MMKDVIIKIDQNSMVYKQETVLGISYENLQGKIIFKFLGTFPKGIAYLEYERDTEKGYLQMNQVGEEYQLEIKSSLLTKEGRIYLQLRVTKDATPEGTPVFKSNKFYLEVKEAINATTEIPDEYPEWIDTANEKIKEMDNLNITTERVEDGVDIVLTDKKGNTTRTEVKDGAPGPQGPQGEPGAVKMQVVDTLPDVGETDTIYLVKKDKPGVQNLYDEYVYTNSSWEHIGDTSVDLSDYYTKEESDKKLLAKQDKLLPGDNITISEDNVISVSGPKIDFPIYIIDDNDDMFFDDVSKYYSLNETVRNKISQNITELYSTGQSSCGFILRDINKSKQYLLSNSDSDIQSKPESFWIFGLNSINNRYTPESAYRVVTAQLSLSLSWSGETCTCTEAIIFLSQIPVLAKDNASEYTPTGDYNPATKKYVDDVIVGSIEFPIYRIQTITNSISTIGYTRIDDQSTLKIAEEINKAYKNGLDSIGFIVSSKAKDEQYLFVNNGAGIQTKPRHYWLYSIDSIHNRYNNTQSYSLLTLQLTISLSWTGDTCSCTSALIWKVELPLLATNNSAKYTPTGDYNPSTKLYTDKTHYENMAGYDATKTQVLKNINGTLTWVDEV
jgi:hypothetical protein